LIKPESAYSQLSAKYQGAQKALELRRQYSRYYQKMLLFIVFENPDEVKRDIAVMLIPPANFPILTPFTMLVHASTGFHAVDRFSILVLTIHWKEDFRSSREKLP